MKYINQIPVLSLLYNTPIPILYQQQLQKYLELCNYKNTKKQIEKFHRLRIWKYICKVNHLYPEGLSKLSTTLTAAKLSKLSGSERTETPTLLDVFCNQEQIEEEHFGLRPRDLDHLELKNFKIIEYHNGERWVLLQELCEVWKKQLQWSRAEMLINLESSIKDGDELINGIVQHIWNTGEIGIPATQKQVAKYQLIEIRRREPNGPQKPPDWIGKLENGDILYAFTSTKKGKKLNIGTGANLYDAAHEAKLAMLNIASKNGESIKITNSQAKHLTTDEMMIVANCAIVDRSKEV